MLVYPGQLGSSPQTGSVVQWILAVGDIGWWRLRRHRTLTDWPHVQVTW